MSDRGRSPSCPCPVDPESNDGPEPDCPLHGHLLAPGRVSSSEDDAGMTRDEDFPVTDLRPHVERINEIVREVAVR